MTSAVTELRNHLLWFLEGRLLTEDELSLWSDLIALLSEGQCTELFSLLYNEVKECDERTIENVQAYVLFLSRIRTRREDYLQKLAEDGNLAPAVEALLQAKAPDVGSLDDVFESNEDFAMYLAKLSVLTLELFKEQVQADDALSEEVKSTVLTMLSEVQKENFAAEKEAAEKLRTLSRGIAEAILLQNMITRLETLSC
jgi:hypothetical protein